ncbi:MAG: alpha/beta hydrolase fold-domain-containing protein [Piptocephalis tieghemiana]|nr:MAG: alpha/beta hydrolase fold-domain-containing protein [Piptocephalis tieghemiana]
MSLSDSQGSSCNDQSPLDQLRRPHPRPRAFTRSGTTRASLRPHRVPRGLLTSLGHVALSVPTVTKRRLQGKSHHPNWSFRTEYTTSCLRFTLDAPDPAHQRRLTRLTRALARLRSPDLVVTPAKGVSGEELGFWTWLRTGIKGGLDPTTTAPLHATTINILFIHGGGFISGHPSMHLSTYQRILKALASAVASCGSHFFRLFAFTYPLAPEHPYPAAPNTLLATYVHLCSQNLIHPSHTLLLGESSGGLLAVDLLNQIHAHHPSWMPLGCVLVSPWTDLRTHTWNGGVTREDTRKDYLSPRSILACTEMYLGGSGVAPHNDRISPILTQDMSHLPPMLISAGSSELLRGTIASFYERLQGSFGVPVALDTAPFMPHAHPFHPTVYPKEAHLSWTRMAKWMVRRVMRGRARTGSFITAPPIPTLPFTLVLPPSTRVLSSKDASFTMTRARRRSSSVNRTTPWFHPSPYRSSSFSCAGCDFLNEPKILDIRVWFHPMSQKITGGEDCVACRSFLHRVRGKGRVSRVGSIPWFSPEISRVPYGMKLVTLEEDPHLPSLPIPSRSLSPSISTALSSSPSQCTIAVEFEEEEVKGGESKVFGVNGLQDHPIELVDGWFQPSERQCCATCQ